MAQSNANSNHERDDANDRGTTQPERNDRPGQSVLNWGGKVVANFYQSVANDRTIPAIAREAVKDVRDTVNQVFFGQHERGGEIGAPMNPLASEIANDNVLHAMTDRSSLPSPSQIAGNAYGQPSVLGKGQEFQQAGWVDYILGRGKDETPYNVDRQHIKPEDEKEQRKEDEKGKDRDDNDRDNDGRGGRGGFGGGREC